jgi:gluconate transporter
MNSMVIVHLVITILLVLFLIMKLRLNAGIALVIGALYMGVACGLPLDVTVQTVSQGFGGTMGGIGLTIAFGIMLGELVAVSGGIQSIASTFLKLTGVKGSIWALALTGFLVSIPVFYDVVFVILVPLAASLSQMTKMKFEYYVGALVVGAGIAHCFVPPTPGPLASAAILNVPLGTMIGVGIVIGIPILIASVLVYKVFFVDRPGFWNPAKDVDVDIAADAGSASFDSSKLPGFVASILPIALPVVFILIGTVSQAIYGKEVPAAVKFLSDRTVAMLAGTIAAYVLASTRVSHDQIDKSISKALAASGVVLVITGAGGSLGAVLGKTDIGNVMVAASKSLRLAPVVLAFIVAVLIKLAQGSGTVAMITTAGLIAPMLQQTGSGGLWVAMAASAGGIALGHINDSGFWVTAKTAGLTTSGGLKTYTLACTIVAVVAMVFIVIGQVLFPAL